MSQNTIVCDTYATWGFGELENTVNFTFLGFMASKNFLN